MSVRQTSSEEIPRFCDLFASCENSCSCLVACFSISDIKSLLLRLSSQTIQEKESDPVCISSWSMGVSISACDHWCPKVCASGSASSSHRFTCFTSSFPNPIALSPSIIPSTVCWNWLLALKTYQIFRTGKLSLFAWGCRNIRPNICVTSVTEDLFASEARMYANEQSHPSLRALIVMM